MISKKTCNKLLLILLIITICLSLIISNKDSKVAEEYSIENVIVKKDSLSVLNVNPKEGLLFVLIEKEVLFPEIVYAQAILETGNFTSNLCINKNNLFGLYNSKRKEFYSFEKWEDSVDAYKKYIQYKYKGGDYFKFLDSIGYAEDPNYIKKLKIILK